MPIRQKQPSLLNIESVKAIGPIVCRTFRVSVFPSSGSTVCRTFKLTVSRSRNLYVSCSSVDRTFYGKCAEQHVIFKVTKTRNESVESVEHSSRNHCGRTHAVTLVEPRVNRIFRT